jgi:hypothetical protein
MATILEPKFRIRIPNAQAPPVWEEMMSLALLLVCDI